MDWDGARSAQLKGDEDFESARRTTAHRDVPTAEDSRVANLAAKKPVDSLRLGVRETGIQFVSTAALTDALGESQSTVESLLSRGGFTLTKQGQPVWWMADPITLKKKSAGMYFYGESIHDLYSPDQAYRLTRGAGPVMPAVTVVGGTGGAERYVRRRQHQVDAFRRPRFR